MRQADRLSTVLERISGSGSVGVGELAEELGVSPATIRRDLRLLEEQHLLARTHGGAVGQGVLYELPLRYRSARYGEEKRRIAREAATRITEGMAVGLTGGTTTTEIARALVSVPRLTVVTNSLSIASELAVRPNLKLVVTGGVARAESYELVGPLAEASLAGLNLDHVMIGVDGISARAGLTTHHEVEAHANLALIDRSSAVTVVCDSSKLGEVAFARICDLTRVYEVITDTSASACRCPRTHRRRRARHHRVNNGAWHRYSPLFIVEPVGCEQLFDDVVDRCGRERRGGGGVEQCRMVNVFAAVLERRGDRQLTHVQEGAVERRQLRRKVTDRGRLHAVFVHQARHLDARLGRQVRDQAAVSDVAVDDPLLTRQDRVDDQ